MYGVLVICLSWDGLLWEVQINQEREGEGQASVWWFSVSFLHFLGDCS